MTVSVAPTAGPRPTPSTMWCPQPRRRSLLGELRGVPLDLQPPKGRQAGDRAGLVAAPGADVAEGPALAPAVDDQITRPGLGALPRRKRSRGSFLRVARGGDTVCVVSAMEIHLYLPWRPVVLVVVLAALIWRHKGPHPATYKLTEPGGIPRSCGPPPTGMRARCACRPRRSEFSVGGGASGKW